jgi:hypothetical protein
MSSLYEQDFYQWTIEQVAQEQKEIRRSRELWKKYDTDQDCRDLVNDVCEKFIELFDQAVKVLNTEKGSERHRYRKALQTIGLIPKGKKPLYNSEAMAYRYIELVTGGVDIEVFSEQGVVKLIEPLSKEHAIRVLARENSTSEQAVYQLLARRFRRWKADGRQTLKLPRYK